MTTNQDMLDQVVRELRLLGVNDAHVEHRTYCVEFTNDDGDAIVFSPSDDDAGVWVGNTIDCRFEYEARGTTAADIARAIFSECFYAA